MREREEQASDGLKREDGDAAAAAAAASCVVQRRGNLSIKKREEERRSRRKGGGREAERHMHTKAAPKRTRGKQQLPCSFFSFFLPRELTSKQLLSQLLFGSFASTRLPVLTLLSGDCFHSRV